MKQHYRYLLICLTAISVSTCSKAEERQFKHRNGLRAGQVPAYMELPACAPEQDVYIHNFILGDSSVRNFAFSYDAVNHLPRWVAYPLSKVYTSGESGRTSAWNYDPLVSYREQPYLQYSYVKVNGVQKWERGHLLPSADRQCCYTANAQTFYYTNMAPQTHAFNAGIWGNLESKARDWSARLDTLYIVTGPILGSVKENASDRQGNSIPVPTKFYKVFLGKLSNPSSGHCGYIGAAFLFTHKNYGGVQPGKDHCLSIRDLEQITGEDFFHNLLRIMDKSDYNALEKEDPRVQPFWWR